MIVKQIATLLPALALFAFGLPASAQTDLTCADIVFTPEVDEIYHQGFQTYVEVSQLEKHLCGPFRNGHFRGVATVVLKLFNIVKPHVSIFGEKDFQQLKIVQKIMEHKDIVDMFAPIAIPAIEKIEKGLMSRIKGGLSF